MFIKIASQFRKPTGFLGKIVSAFMVKHNRIVYNKLIHSMQISLNDKILEIGYGPGIGINMIAESNGVSKIHGIDFSEQMFRKATKRNKKFILDKKVNLLFGDFIESQIDESDFDKVFCINVVYFWKNLQLPFEKIYTLLKNGGTFHFYMASKEDLNKLKFTKDEIFNKHSIEYVVENLKNVGFQNIEYQFEKGYFVKAGKLI